MPLSTIPTLDAMEAIVFGFFRTAYTGGAQVDLSQDSWLGKLARSIAASLWGYQYSVYLVGQDWPPGAQSSGASLDIIAQTFGLDNGQGGLGRKIAVPATSGAGHVFGSNGTVYPINSLLTAPDNVTVVKLVAAVTIVIGGTIAALFNAVTTGTAGNLPINTPLTWQSPPLGSTSTAINDTAALTGGTGLESNDALLARVLARLQNPPKGGTRPDWEAWGDHYAAVSRTYVYPKRNGTGTVATVEMQSGSGATRIITDSILAANISSYISSQRPITVEGHTETSAYNNTVHALTVRTRIVPAAAYPFDWARGTTSYTVGTYSTGPVRIKLNGVLAPSDLKAAITAGTKPRIMVAATGGQVVPPPVGCTAFSDSGGETTLTLDTLPTGWVAPSVGDVIYSYSDACPFISAAQLDYINGLGPSRISGAPEATDPWNDTVETEQLSSAALTTRSDYPATAGAVLADNIVKSSGIPQLTIAVGNLSATTNDYQAQDDGINPPEICIAKFVIVSD